MKIFQSIYFFKLWLKMKIKNLFSNSLIMYLGSFNTLCLKKLSGLVFTIKINFFAVLLVKLTFLMRDEVQCQVVFQMGNYVLSSSTTRGGVTIDFSEMRGPIKIFGPFCKINGQNILFGPLISENSIVTPPLVLKAMSLVA